MTSRRRNSSGVQISAGRRASSSNLHITAAVLLLATLATSTAATSGLQVSSPGGAQVSSLQDGRPPSRHPPRQIPHHIPAKWLAKRQSDDQTPASSEQPASSGGGSSSSLAPAVDSSTRHAPSTTTSASTRVQSAIALKSRQRRSEDVCADRLCYGLPMGCLDRSPGGAADVSRFDAGDSSGSASGALCSVLVTSKRYIDPNRPVARDIHFELLALPVHERGNYAAVGFSETGRMSGLVTECLQYRDPATQLQIIKLAHSYNIPGAYNNVPATILSGIMNQGVSYENGYYQCRWVVESAVEFTYEDPNNGSVVNKREDLGYRNYHVLLAAGIYDEKTNYKHIHTDRVSSMTPISLAQTGLVKSLGSHILVRIHGSLMVTIWIGLVTISVMLARYYKNEWADSKINDSAIWFVLHRAFMLIAWFGSIIAVIFAYMYTETYHPGVHQIAGTTCLVLSTIQVMGGLLRPSLESNKRAYFNWTHFICGNLSYLFAMISIITAAFLAPAHLPPLYIWVVAVFVAIYALTHLLMTIHQYIVHKSSKISITPKGDLGQYVKRDSYPFRQVMLGILVATVIFIVLLLLWIIAIRAT